MSRIRSIAFLPFLIATGACADVEPLDEIQLRSGIEDLDPELLDQLEMLPAEESPLGGGLPCGGFAGIECPGDQVCMDDPTDDCDPKKGGADCPGVCRGKPADKGGVPCGDVHCGANMVCCNASCGICTPPDGACIQIVCL